MTQHFSITPIGVVHSPRTDPVDDGWDAIISTIELDSERFGRDALQGLDAFSHVEVVYLFHRVDPDAIRVGARHPRGNEAWPEVGIFAQRAKARPNRLGVSACALLKLADLTLTVRGLDAIDGTPVLDLKPVMAEFGPRGERYQPEWSGRLMAGYW